MTPRMQAQLPQVVSDSKMAATSGRSALIRLSKRVQALADQEIALCQADAKDTWKPACRKGCDACCTRLVEATLPEAVAVQAHLLENWTKEHVEALIERTDKAQEGNRLLWEDAIGRPLAACPFLEDGACSIYEVRPVSCRAVNAADANACDLIYLKGQQADPKILKDQLEVSTVARAVVLGSREAVVSTGLFELGPTVKLLLEDPPLADRLNQPQPVLEKFKLFSEWSSPEDRYPETILRAGGSQAARTAIGFGNEIDLSPLKEAVRRLEGTAAGAVFGMRLPHMYRSVDHAEEAWSDLEAAILHFEEFEGNPREVFELFHVFHTFGLAYADKDVLPPLQRIMRKLCQVSKSAFPALAAPIDRKRKPGKFRLGFISKRLTRFNGARWALGTIRVGHPEIETYAINAAPMEDSTSFCFRRAADRYMHLPFPADVIADQVRVLDLDALVFTDVGMDGPMIQLASLRLARKQFAGWGHPVTTGSPQIEGYLSAEHMEPADGDDHYSERLIRLPKDGLSSPYRQPVVSERTAAEIGLPEGGFLLFGQSPPKLHPKWDELFRRIARESPVPLVVMSTRKEPEQALLKARLGEDNIVHMPIQTLPDFLRTLQLACASIESPNFGGGFTALDALTQGTPVISLPGRYMRGRLSRGFAIEAGLGEWIAESEDDFVAKCVASANRHRGLAVDSESLYSNREAVDRFHFLLLEETS